MSAVLRLGRSATATGQNRSSNSCGTTAPAHRRTGMSAQELKRAIRDNHDVTRHDEFFGNVMAKHDLDLLDLYLASKRRVPERLDFGNGLAYPRSPRVVRRLL